MNNEPTNIESIDESELPVLSLRYAAVLEQYFSNGFKKIDAYSHVYQCNRDAAAAGANRLFSKNPDFIAVLRYRELLESSKYKDKRVRIIADLEEIINNTKNTDNNICLRAIGELNKVLGHYSPEKFENTHEIVFKMSIPGIENSGQNLIYIDAIEPQKSLPQSIDELIDNDGDTNESEDELNLPF